MFSALGIKADLILTRDQEGFTRSAVKACGYEELFAYLKETLGCEYELLDGSFWSIARMTNYPVVRHPLFFKKIVQSVSGYLCSETLDNFAVNTCIIL